jgi:hypothetical protein
MAIRALSRQEFTRFSPAQAALADLTSEASEAVEWFAADDTGLFFGAVVRSHSALQWWFVVLGHNSSGHVDPVCLQFGVSNAEEARRLLLSRMATALATADEVCIPPPAV